jgi:hypothetical protein
MISQQNMFEIQRIELGRRPTGAPSYETPAEFSTIVDARRQKLVIEFHIEIMRKTNIMKLTSSLSCRGGIL